MVAPPLGRHDKVGRETGGEWLHQDVRSLFCADAARGVADDPPDCIAGCHRHKIFAGLQGDVGDGPGRGVDLVDRAVAERENLDRIHEALRLRLQCGCAIGRSDTRHHGADPLPGDRSPRLLLRRWRRLGNRNGPRCWLWSRSLGLR